MTQRLKFILIVCLLLCGTVAAAAAGVATKSQPDPSAMALHKAIYDFRLISVEQGAGLTGVHGQMYFEQDDACDAWTNEHRFTVDYHYPERRPVRNTNHYVSWESKDGNRFHFNSDRQEDGIVIEQLRGKVARGIDASKAEYVRPEGVAYDLPQGFVLPAQHTDIAIEHARKGERLFSVVLFDGTDAGGPVEVNTFIGEKLTPQQVMANVGESPRIDRSLLTGDAWRMRMAFFPLRDEEAMTPAYEMDMVLHANGVVSHVIVDYKSFKIEQKLNALERIPGRTCG